MSSAGGLVEAVEQSILVEARIEVGYADHKASMVLASVGIGFGALIGGFFAGSWRPSQLETWSETCWWLGIVIAATSVVLSASAVWPRYRKGNPKKMQQIHFWGDVASFDSLEALSAHLDAHPPQPTNRTREQMWQLSRIVNIKYERIRGSFIAAAIAVALFGASVLSRL